MAFAGDSIYWVEVEKVVPNPFQPRREFDQERLKDLAESIRMYGVLQPLTVTRKEIQREDGTFYSEYELIAGERRLRASKLAGIAQVPVIIRDGEQSEQEKLELAIIENLQREDLNAIDRALAFQQLAEQFKMTHVQVAQKVGRSREYVANSIRLLRLPEHMRDAVRRGELGEGHARTLLMLADKPEEQETIFRETLLKKLSVRELERIARRIAKDRVRKPHASDVDEHLLEIEKEFTETLGTRVSILKTEFGGKLTIDYFSEEDLDVLLQKIKEDRAELTFSGAPATTTAVAALATATPLVAAAETTHEMPPTVAATPQSAVEQSPTVSAAEPVAQPAQPLPPPPTSEMPTPTATPATVAAPTPTPATVPAASVVPLHDVNAAQPAVSAVAPPVAPAPAAVPPPPPTMPPTTTEAVSSTDTPSALDVKVEPESAPSEATDDDLYSFRNFTL